MLLLESLASPVAQIVKNMPEMQETQVRSLEEEMAIHSSILAWKVPWTEEPGGLQSMGSLVGYSLWGCKELFTTEQLTLL